MKWHDRPSTVDEIQLIAWANMLDDDQISVYTFENGKEHRHYVNPHLAFKRIMRGFSTSMTAVRDKIQSDLVPAFIGMSEEFQKFVVSLPVTKSG